MICNAVIIEEHHLLSFEVDNDFLKEICEVVDKVENDKNYLESLWEKQKQINTKQIIEKFITPNISNQF